MVMKLLLFLRLRAIWNKDFVGERFRKLDSELVIFIIDHCNCSHTHSVFHYSRYVRRISYLISRD